MQNNSQTRLLLDYCLNLSKPWSTTTYTTCYINQLWKGIEELQQGLNFKDNISTLQPLLSSGPLMHSDPRNVQCQVHSAQPGWEEDDKHRENHIANAEHALKKSHWSNTQDTSSWAKQQYNTKNTQPCNKQKESQPMRWLPLIKLLWTLRIH